MTVKEAAKYLQVNVETVRRYVRSKKLPAFKIKIKGHWYWEIDQSELEDSIHRGDVRYMGILHPWD